MVDIIRVGQPRRQIVGHRGQIVGQTAAGGGTPNNYTRAEYRIAFYTPSVDIADLQVAFGGFFNSAGEQSNPATIVVDCGIEFNGVFKRFLFNGASSFSLVSGMVVYTDVLGIDIPANTKVYIRGEGIVASGANFPQGYYLSDTGDGFFNSTAASSQVVGTGAMSLPSGGEIAVGGSGPLALLGKPRTKVPAIGIIGDSIDWGLGDTPDTNGNLGFWARGLFSVNGGAVPQYRATRSGDTLALNSVTNCDKKRLMLQHCTHSIHGLASNDIASAVALATIQTEMQSMWAASRRRGHMVCERTIPTRTSSTDGWTTSGNQTVTTGFTVGGLCDQVNSWIFTQIGQGLLDSVFDIRPYIQDGNNKWLTPGGVALTADGTHPNPAGNLLIAPAVTALVATW